MAGIYIHIPFCKTRCIYCDFFSTTQSQFIDPYIDAVCEEIIMRKEYLENDCLETVYIGGGTPSQLSEKQLNKIFHTLSTHFKTDKLSEITLEANPDDLNSEYLKMLQNLPINRLSIGIQSFQDEMLKKLNRRHTSEQAITAVNKARQYGFDNISIDLMYGLPYETMEAWINDIYKAISLDVEHISAYHLIYEEGTVLHKKLTTGSIQEVDENFSLQSFTNLIKILTKNGFTHYEISNFAKDGKIAQHNTAYWTGKKYLGCGPSSHSYNGLERCWNASSLSEYFTQIRDKSLKPKIEILDIKTQYNDLIITSLRTMWGLDLNILKSKFGTTYYNYALNMAQKHLNSHNLELKNNRLILTQKGIFISDGIMSDLLMI